MRDRPTDDMDLRTDRPMNGWTYERKVEQTALKKRTGRFVLSNGGPN